MAVETTRARRSLPASLLVTLRSASRSLGVSRLDWKLGARLLLKTPGLSLIGGVALAGVIAIAVIAFELVYENVQPDLPLDEGDRVVRIGNWDASTSSLEPRSLYDFAVWRANVESIVQLGAYRSFERNLFVDGDVGRPVRMAEISAVAFPLTRVAPLLGRGLTEADEQPGAPPVSVLGYDLWRSRFNGDPDILGRNIRLGRATSTVVGVMPEGFAFPTSQELWVPLQAAAVPLPREGAEISAFGRLAPGATFESAQAELTALGRRAAVESPATHEHLEPQVRPYVGRLPGDGVSPVVLIMYAVVALILLGACANVATLIFARTALRQFEIVVRSALGASRRHVIGQLFVEALVLAGVAALCGLAVARLVLHGYERIATQWLPPQPFWVDASIEPAAIVYTAVLAVIGAALISVVPALAVTGGRVPNGLQGAGGIALRFGNLWSFIIVAQVAITVVTLPIAVGVSIETVRDRALLAAFPSEQYLTFRPELDRERAAAAAVAPDGRLAAIYDELERRLLAEPGVTDVTVATRLPGMDGPIERVEFQRGAEPPAFLNANMDGYVAVATVGVDLFEAFDAPLLAGRSFEPRDAEPASRTVVVNRSFAQNLGGNALGVRVRLAARGDEAAGEWYEIVGVVENLGVEPTDRGEADFLFRPTSVTGTEPLTVAVRMSSEPSAFAPRLAAIAAELDPGLRLYDVLALDEVVYRRQLPTILATLGFTSVVAFAALLAAAGLYALMSVGVARRTREIGIRVALGASRRSVLKAIFGRAAWQLVIGIAAGNVIVLTLAATLAGGISPRMLIPLGIISTFMALVGVLACAVPARRALRVQPTDALKEA